MLLGIEYKNYTSGCLTMPAQLHSCRDVWSRLLTDTAYPGCPLPGLVDAALTQRTGKAPVCASAAHGLVGSLLTL